jgi:hypothetical protein
LAGLCVNSGGVSWYPPSIDLDTDRVFWAVANPAPFPGTATFPNGTSRIGDNLYSDSTLVLDVHTGKYQWHPQPIQTTSSIAICCTPADRRRRCADRRVWANRRNTGEVLWGALLYLKLTDMPPCGSRMPPTGPLSAAELDPIRTWIMNGAADN